MTMPRTRGIGLCRAFALSSIALSSLTCLSGCVVGPVYQPPIVHVPERWGQEPVASSPTVQSDSVDHRWWRGFRDPLLVSLVDRLGTQNLDLRTAYERVLQSEARIRITAAQGLPKIEGASQETYNRQSPNGPLSLSQKAPGAQLDYWLYAEGLNASWELDFFGRVRHALEAADAETLVAIEARHGIALATLGDLAEGYLNLRGVQARLAIARRNLSLAEQDVALVQSRFANGVANTLDLAQARAQQATIAAGIPPLLAQQAELINAIGLLLGEEPRALEAVLRPPKSLPRVPRSIPIGLPVTLLGRRPDVREAEARLRAAVARTGVAVASFYPSVSLTGMVDVQSLTLGRLFNLASTAWQVGPSVTIPIFEGGRLKANLELRESEGREAAVAFQKAVLTAWRQVDDARTAYVHIQQRRARLAEAVAQNQIALTSARQRYTEGASDFLNVNTVLGQLLQSQNDLAEAEVQTTTTLVRLYRALGGGWEIVDASVRVPGPSAAGPPLAIPTLLDGLASEAVDPRPGGTAPR